MSQENNFINIFGAREHKLKDIDLQIPRNRVVEFTGLSGLKQRLTRGEFEVKQISIIDHYMTFSG
jgi:ABC-type phosphate transport system ATPase subunit